LCVKILQQKFVENKRESTDIPVEKACTQCKIVFWLDNFYTDKQKFDGKGTKCKSCFLKLRNDPNKEVKNLTEKIVLLAK
jgi:hypothetical protein